MPTQETPPDTLADKYPRAQAQQMSRSQIKSVVVKFDAVHKQPTNGRTNRMTLKPASERKSWWYWIRMAGLMAGFSFMAWLLWDLLRNPNLLQGHFSTLGIVEAVAIGVISNVIVSIAFSDMVAKFSPSIRFQRRVSAYYYSQIAKYIPGQIAALLVQRSILAGPRASAATLVSNLELMMISCWLCSSAAIVLLVLTVSSAGAGIAAIFSVAIGAWLIRMNWQPYIRRLMRLIPKYRALGEVAPHSLKISRLRAGCLSTCILVLPALSSYVLLAGGMNIDHSIALPLTASLMLAWVIGVLAFVFPAGIGVRELIFFGLGNALLSGVSNELMTEVALASRLVHVLVDIVGVASFIAVKQLYTWTARFHRL